ncbi:MAG: fibronectin type III domain-containing protein [Planctomycetota bacterium]|jgi:hypothetical protein
MNLPGKRQTISSILWASLLLLALFPPRSSASSLTLAWDPNTELDLAGYKVSYGTRPGDYDFTIDVGNVTQYTVTGLEPGSRYYFVLTAYDTSLNESDFSPEVSAVTGNELAVDFGSDGLYQYDGSSWSRLTVSNPQHLAVYNNKLVADFGSDGLWQFDGFSWSKLTPSDADSTGNCMVAYGASLVVDFGSGGIWEYDGSAWSRLTASDPEYMAIYDNKLVGDFGSGGLWEFDGTSWTKLTQSDADNGGNSMVANGANLAIDFGGGGIWEYDGSSWSSLTPYDPEDLSVCGSKLVGDFGLGGLWQFGGTSWTKLTQSGADNNGNRMVAVDFP